MHCHPMTLLHISPNGSSLTAEGILLLPTFSNLCSRPPGELLLATRAAGLATSLELVEELAALSSSACTGAEACCKQIGRTGRRGMVAHAKTGFYCGSAQVWTAANESIKIDIKALVPKRQQACKR